MIVEKHIRVLYGPQWATGAASVPTQVASCASVPRIHSVRAHELALISSSCLHPTTVSRRSDNVDGRCAPCKSVTCTASTIHRQCHFSSTPSLGERVGRASTRPTASAERIRSHDRPRRPSLPSAGCDLRRRARWQQRRREGGGCGKRGVRDQPEVTLLRPTYSHNEPSMLAIVRTTRGILPHWCCINNGPTLYYVRACVRRCVYGSNIGYMAEQRVHGAAMHALYGFTVAIVAVQVRPEAQTCRAPRRACRGAPCARVA